MGKRARIAELLDRVGISATVTALRERLQPTWLTVLTYHRIGTPPGGDLDADIYDVGERQFADELAYLSEHFRFVTSEDVIAFLEGAPLPPNPVMITFDDGYVECRRAALPLLLKHGALRSTSWRCGGPSGGTR
jgi:hypothetical protein